MQNNPLDQLRDIHLPEPISWWPLAPGWWFVIILVIGIFVWLSLTLVKRNRLNLYRRQAIAKLNMIDQDTAVNSKQKLTTVIATLKQAVNTAYPDYHFSSQNLVTFLKFTGSTCSQPIFMQIPDNIENYLYGTESNEHSLKETLENILTDSKIWIKNHYSQEKILELGLCSI
jgi:hypothetical protein